MKIKEITSDKKAFNEALKILARKDVSSSLLLSKLLSKGFAEDEAVETVDKLKEKQMLNDEKLALRQTENLLKKGKGYFYIKYHMQNEGLGEPPSVTYSDEAAAIMKIFKQKAFTKKDLKETKKKLKMIVFLSRRGFRQDAIFKAIGLLTEK